MDKERLTPPDMILVFVILQVIVHFLFPVSRIIYYPYTLLGMFLIFLGAIPNVYGYFIFGKNKTSVKIYEMPSKLITAGLFRISRNPTYLGMAIMLLGVALLLGSLFTFIFPILFVILTDRLVIPNEERNLRKTFGVIYIRYCRRVRRWI